MKYINVDDQNYVRTVCLNRPELHNAFNAEMIAELTTAFQEVPMDLRAVFLHGEGKSFCAGADLSWMKSMVDYSLEENQEDSWKLFDMFAAIRECRVPVVTYVHGNCFGGGLGLAAASDIVFAEESTKFCFSEVKLGIAPAVISPFVIDKVKEAQVREWMLTAKVFSATEAYFGGLINLTGPEVELVEKREKELNRLVEAGAEGVQATKALLNSLKSMDWPVRKTTTAKVIAERRVSKEGQEGLRSFLEKRAPAWKVSRRDD